MLTKEECHNYWKNEVNCMDNPNNAFLYADKPCTIINYLHNFWLPEVSIYDKVFELGCNSGANLEHLRNIGYLKLYGIDINESAIFKLSQIFPELYNNSKLYVGSLEDTLINIPNKSIDVTFSMYTLGHIHPDSIDEISKQIVRITNKYIITIEEEKESINDRIFIRNYKEVFEKEGCKEIKYKKKTEIPQEVIFTKIINQLNKVPTTVYRHSFDYFEVPSRMFKVI